MNFHIVTTNRVGDHHAPAPLADHEVIVRQYGNRWIAHVERGGVVRNGNVLVIDVEAERQDMRANGIDPSDLTDTDVRDAYLAGLT